MPRMFAEALVESWVVWVVAGIALVAIEILTPGFVVACVGVAALVTAVPAALDASLAWQLVTFAAANVAVFAALRPFMMRLMSKSAPAVKTNIEALVGKTAVVTERIDDAAGTGRVKVQGDDWRGICEDGKTIEAGGRVEVLRVEGAKLVVRPADERAG
jgi:membrane protein implicated in regulation of membrane protease activity